MADDDDLPDAAAVPENPRRKPFDPIELTVRTRTDLRLDQYFHLHLPDYSRSDLQHAIKNGSATVNGKPSKASYKVRNDDKLVLILPEPTHDYPVPENIPLDVLYDDEVLAVINKPWDMVVHPAKGNWSGTLVNALQFRFNEQLSEANGQFRAGIVHRLDKDTSGVILVAKDERAHRHLALQFEHRTVFKEYVALTAGELDRDSDYIDAPMKQHPHDRVKMIVSTDPDAKPATSYYEVLERFRGHTLVKFQPKTGRTHQIRVHLAHIGCPVLSDKLYGGRATFRMTEVDPKGDPDDVLLDRQALHAYRLRFEHPVKKTWMEVEAPLPADMRRTLDALRQFRGR